MRAVPYPIASLMGRETIARPVGTGQLRALIAAVPARLITSLNRSFIQIAPDVRYWVDYGPAAIERRDGESGPLFRTLLTAATSVAPRSAP